jgi:hypothetical protein
MNQFSRRERQLSNSAQSTFQFPLDQYLGSSIGEVRRATFGKVCVIVKLDHQQRQRCCQGESSSGEEEKRSRAEEGQMKAALGTIASATSWLDDRLCFARFVPSAQCRVN